MSARECRRARELWSDEFDGGTPAPTWVRLHAQGCRECSEFRTQSLRLRQELGDTPLPRTTVERDEQLLTLLQAEPAAPARAHLWNQVDWIRRVLGFSTAPTLVGVGLGAFLVTLVAAQLLSSPATEHPERVVPGSSSAREPDGGGDNRALELWLTSPQPRRIPQPGPRKDALPLRGGEHPPEVPDRRRSGGFSGRAEDLT